MTTFEPVALVSTELAAKEILKIASVPPALTRLEPQSVAGDPRHGAEAVVADPLWLLGRQWQLGELLGEDVGSPVSVRVERRALPITAWAPAGRDDGADGVVADPDWRPWPEGGVLDELVEHVPRQAAEGGLRWRAQSGAQLAEMLAEAGLADAARLVLDAHPLTLVADPADPAGSLDPAAQRLLLALEGAVPDGGAARAALQDGDPDWVTGAGEPDKVRDVAHEWLGWVAGAPDAGGAWTTARLEHRFLLRFGHGAGAVVLSATGFSAGGARWHHFEWQEDAAVAVDGDANLPADEPTTDTMLATPLRYPGMPADRYWQLEDRAVDISAIEAQPHDLARLCLAEFALVTGDDWLVVPLDGKLGAINQVATVVVTTTFGETIPIAEAADDRRARGFRMFEVTSASGTSLPGVVLPPIAATPLLGDPVEEIAFVRDETANLAWAVERIVPGRSGDPRQRSAEPQPQRPAPPADLDPEDVLYELEVPVPRHWIPLVPVATAPAVVALRKGALLDDGEPVLPAGLLLEPTPLTFPAEEIPREGITVRAVPALARRRDGTYARWTGHRIRTGRGEGSSGLASDEARPARGPAV
ncbi:MAG TPA: hypothetical protein VNT03_17660 [Baekduia sp.]|nr:hypothetical protein [Baekduia sp.]